MKAIQKPIGIYVLTILLILGAGVLPLLATVNAIRQAGGDVSSTMVFVSFFLSAFSIFSSIWAFVGHNEGRIAVLIFVSLNFLWWVFLSITNVANSEAEAFSAGLLLIGLIRPTIFFVLFWWYLTKKDVVAYYKQGSRTNSE